MKDIFNFKSIKTSFLILLAVPVLSIIYFSYNYLERPLELSDKMKSVEELSSLAVISSDLVHELQKERGRTAGFYNSKGAKFTRELPEQRIVTDAKLEEFMGFLEKFDADSFGKEFSKDIQNIKNELGKITSNRSMVDRFKSTAPKVIGYYTETIASILNNVDLIADLSSVNYKLYTMLLAYKNLLEYKERNGITRAVFASIFGRDRFTDFFYKRAISLDAEAKSFYENFKRYATEAQVEEFNKIVKGNDVDEANRMKNYALKNHQSESLGIDVTYWFRMITNKINLVKKVEDIIAEEILQTSTQLSNEAQNTVIINISIVAVIFIIIVLLSIVIIKGILKPLIQAKEAAEKIAQGNLNVNLETHKKDEIGQLIFAMKSMVENISNLSNEADSLILAIENGKLDKRGDSGQYQGRWKDIVNGINKLIDAFVAPFNVTSEYIDRIAKGDIPAIIEDEYNGDFNEIKINLNHCIDALNGFVDEMNHMSKEHDLGDIDVKIDESHFTGCYLEMAHGVNQMVFGHLAVKKKAMACIGELGNGNFDAELETFPGKKVFINEAIEQLRLNLKKVNNELGELIDATRQGRLDTRGNTTGFSGGWAELVTGVNDLIDAFVGPINVTAEYVDRIAKGDIPPKITDEYKGDFNEIKNNLNQAIDVMNGLLEETNVLIAATKDGKLDQRGDSSKFIGGWAELITDVNELIDAFVGPINVTAEYIDRIANGDIPPKIEDEYRGDFNEIKNNLNHCIDALNGFVEEMNHMSIEHDLGEIDVKINEDNFTGCYQEMAHGVNQMVFGHIGVKKKAMACIGEFGNGNFDAELETFPGKKVFINETIEKLRENLKFVSSELSEIIDATREGRLDTRGDTTEFSGSWSANLIDGVNELLDVILEPVNEASDVLEVMAGGDLTPRMTGDYKGDNQKLKKSINTLGDSLSDLIRQVTMSAESVATSSNQITVLSGTLATSSEEQSSQSEEVASAVEEMARTISENAQNATTTSDVADQNRSVANQGGEVVKQTVSKMRDIAEFVSDSAESIEKLGERSTEIGEIVSVIDEIADQTNLLALNAAIEAARAGEQGRGFAVVADEVRKLAERTTDATKQIATMIKGVQKETQDAVVIMKKGNEEVNEGISLADKAGMALEEVVTSSNEVKDMINNIAAASEEQSSTSELMAKNVEAISQVSNESARQITEVSIASEKMGELTHRLLALVDSFKIGGTDGLNSGGTSAGHQDVARLQYRNKDDYSLVAADADDY